MRCPGLADLPPPPAGRTGWPWTIETPAAPEQHSDGQAWPRITVATASYQQGVFIEETIRSVLLQGYPDLEYIVVDGGSTDDTVEILRRYEPWLAYWRSAPDRGQVSAINDALSRASGHWRAWLNSDDFYVQGALQQVGSAPETASWLVGLTGYVDAASRPIGQFPVSYRSTSLVVEPAWIDVLCAKASGTALPQQSTFWSAAAHEAVGALDESLEYVFEHEYWVRLSYAGFVPVLLDRELTMYRYHAAQKTRPSTRAAAYFEEAQVTTPWLDRCPEEYRTILRAYRRLCSRGGWVERGRRLGGRLASPLLTRRRSASTT